MSTATKTPFPVENVWSYPRPPALLPTDRLLEIHWINPSNNRTLIASTSLSSAKGDIAYRVLETSHPPTFYLPPSALAQPELLTEEKGKKTLCEWKGVAKYWNFTPPATEGGGKPSASDVIKSRIWSYPSPTPSFKPIAKYLSFYASSSSSSAGADSTAGHWECSVDGEIVTPQDGDFYGGWKHEGIVGKMKGGAGTWGW